MNCNKWFPVKLKIIPIADRGIQFGPNSKAIWIIGECLYRSLKGVRATHSSLGFSLSSSEELSSSSRPALRFLSFSVEFDCCKFCGGAEAAGAVVDGFINFLYRHLMKPLELVLELTPKFWRVPPPKASPCSRIASPSPEPTNSANLLKNDQTIILPVGPDRVAEETEGCGAPSDYDDVGLVSGLLPLLHSVTSRGISVAKKK